MNKTKIKQILSMFAAGLLCVAIGCCIGLNIGGTSGKANMPVLDVPTLTANSNDGLVVTPESTKTMKLTATPLSATSVSDDGIAAYAETGYTLTATITPDSATNKQVDWTVAWQNASSAFASGKAVTDYVTVTPTSDGALTATLNCAQAFGEKIIVTCTSRDNPEASATCTLDYSQKVESVSLKFGNLEANLGGTTNVKFEVNPNGVGPGGATNVAITKSSVYTVADNFTYDVYLSSVSAVTGELSAFFSLNGKTITTGSAWSLSTEFSHMSYNNSGLYFDYAHEVKGFMIIGRSSDILFSNLSTAEIITYFSDITEGRLFYVNIDVTGQYSDYSAHSLFTCTGYTNQASVTGLSLGDSWLVL